MALRVSATILRHRYFVPVVGVLLSLAALWTLGRPLPEIERARRHFVDLQRQRAVAQRSSPDRAVFRARAASLSAELAASGAERRSSLNNELATLWTQTVWADRAAVREAVLASPLVALPRATKIAGTVPVYSARRTGCASCHVAVATPGFESYPEPFRTHVQLSSYVGADSPHPPSRTGCVLCHRGQDEGESFEAAGHSTLRVRVRPDEWRRASDEGADVSRLVVDDGRWKEPDSTGAMLPSGRVGAGCARCHAGERFQPGAGSRNDALTSMDRGGCYGCHAVPGLEDLPRRGPDLRRIRAKLTPQWTRRWIAEPASIKPATWMPRFWRHRLVLQSDDRVEVDAVVAYLFATAAPYTASVPAPPHGDAARGERLVSAIGCLGCHVVGATERDSAGLARTFGPPLQGIGSKTTSPWLYDWLRDPQRYSPGTRMPQFRLSDSEAADITAYLVSLTTERTDASAPEKTDAAAYRDVVRRYAALGATSPRDLGSLDLDAAKQAAGRAVIEVRGCFACHEIAGFEGKRFTAPLSDLRGDSAHLQRRMPSAVQGDLRGGGTEPGQYQPATPDEVTRPGYPLGAPEWERVGLGAAVAAHQQPDDRRITVPWHVAKTSGRALVQRYNCTGCHAVDGAGGDVSAVTPASAGRAPALDAVGSGMTIAQLRAVLRQPATAREGAALRMPTYSLTDDEIATLSGYLQAIAPARPASSANTSESGAAQRSAGR